MSGTRPCRPSETGKAVRQFVSMPERFYESPLRRLPSVATGRALDEPMLGRDPCGHGPNRAQEPQRTRRGSSKLTLMDLNLLRVGSLSIGRGTSAAPLAMVDPHRTAPDQPSRQIHHVQLLLSGRFAIQMEDGEYAEIEPNDVFDVPPGHDVWVLGDEPVVVVDFLGNIEQLGRPVSHDRIVTTLLMTDIVDSTAMASRLGDAT